MTETEGAALGGPQLGTVEADAPSVNGASPSSTAVEGQADAAEGCADCDDALITVPGRSGEIAMGALGVLLGGVIALMGLDLITGGAISRMVGLGSGEGDGTARP